MTLFRRLALLSALCAAPAAAAPEYEKLDLLEARIIATLGAGVGQPGGPVRPVDRRLKLAACPTAPELAVPTPVSAVVRCGARGWRIYVPLVRTPERELAEEKPEPAVRRGDRVEVVASGSGFSVSTLAVAQEDGAPGDRIRIKVDDKKAPYTVEVKGKGRVLLAQFK